MPTTLALPALLTSIPVCPLSSAFFIDSLPPARRARVLALRQVLATAASRLPRVVVQSAPSPGVLAGVLNLVPSDQGVLARPILHSSPLSQALSQSSRRGPWLLTASVRVTVLS